VRESTSLFGLDDVHVRSIAGDGEGWRADVDAAGTAYEVEVRRGGRTDPHLLDDPTQPARRVAGSPRVRGA
jgi:hypothetical protein